MSKSSQMHERQDKPSTLTLRDVFTKSEWAAQCLGWVGDIYRHPFVSNDSTKCTNLTEDEIVRYCLETMVLIQSNVLNESPYITRASHWMLCWPWQNTTSVYSYPCSHASGDSRGRRGDVFYSANYKDSMCFRPRPSKVLSHLSNINLSVLHWGQSL